MDSRGGRKRSKLTLTQDQARIQPQLSRLATPEGLRWQQVTSPGEKLELTLKDQPPGPDRDRTPSSEEEESYCSAPSAEATKISNSSDEEESPFFTQPSEDSLEQVVAPEAAPQGPREGSEEHRLTSQESYQLGDLSIGKIRQMTGKNLTPSLQFQTGRNPVWTQVSRETITQHQCNRGPRTGL